MSTVNVRLLLAFFAIYVVWGSTYLAIQVAVETIPPLATAGVRHLVAGIVLYAWARAWRARVTWTEWRASLVVAVLFFLIGHGTLHWGEQIVPSGIAALLVATEQLDRDADAGTRRVTLEHSHHPRPGRRFDRRRPAGAARGAQPARGRSSCGAPARF